MPRYTLCPYYIDESRKTISCEDVCRSFDSTDSKWAWTDMYCDSWDWMKCPYAADRSEAYRKYEEGDIKALDEQKERATKDEIRSLTTKLGRLNKKFDKLRAKNQDLEAQKKIYYDKWRAAEEQLKEYEKRIGGQIQTLQMIYEQRICYLIENFVPEKKIYEADIMKWAGDKEFALISDIDPRYTNLEKVAWQVVFKEEENEDGQQDKDIQTDVQEGP